MQNTPQNPNKVNRNPNKGKWNQIKSKEIQIKAKEIQIKAKDKLSIHLTLLKNKYQNNKKAFPLLFVYI